MHRLLLLIALFALALNVYAAGDTSSIILNTPTGKIYGTLQTAPGKHTGPVVLIIPGSGPTDRNGNIMMQKNEMYRALADSLAAQGISTLRYDKRGIGESKAAANERDLRFETYVGDVKDWMRLLQGMKQFSRVFVLGHSEGSLIGALAVQGAKGLGGYISVAGPAMPADSMIVQQLSKQMPATMVDSVRMYFAMARRGDSLRNVPRQYYPIFRPSVVPYMMSWIKYDPAVEIAKVTAPTLFIQGTHDLQVGVDQYDLLMKALPGAEGHKIEGMNHIFRNAPLDRQENFGTYSDASLPLNREFVKALTGFIKKHS